MEKLTHELGLKSVTGCKLVLVAVFALGLGLGLGPGLGLALGLGLGLGVVADLESRIGLLGLL